MAKKAAAKQMNPEPAGKAGPAVEEKRLPIEVQMMGSKAKMPGTAYPLDAGHDLTVSDYVSIRPHARVRVQHGIKVAIPPGYFGLVLPRSSTFDRLGVLINPGVIDSGYRGEIMALAYNPSEKMVHLNEGDRVAQLLILPVAAVNFAIVDELPAGERGDNGFGSTTETPSS